MRPTASPDRRRLLPMLLWLLLCAATGCSDAAIAYDEDEEPAGLHSIGWLKDQCRGSSTLITADVVVQGRVVANDAYGEWSRSLVLEDASGGITVYAQADRLADRYPFGASVMLYASGLRLYDYGGKVVLGTADPEPYSWSDSYDFALTAAELSAHLHRTTDAAGPPVARLLTLDAVDAGAVDRYVCVAGVRFVEAGSAWCDRDPSTNRMVTTERTLVDAAGRRLVVRTLGGCSYAGEPLPAGEGTLCGVIDCFNGRCTLRVVNREIDFPDE